MTNIAVLGTGRMGSAVVRRLSAAGHVVTAWSRNPARAAATGAKVAESPAEAVAGADVVITVLTDGAAVAEVLFGSGATLRPGTVLVQMSTIGPEATAAIVERLPGDVSFVDAPVMGSVDAVAAGTLVILASGAVEAAEPVLRHLGTIQRCDAASAVKVMQMTAALTAIGALHDTLEVAAALGIDRAAAMELLAAGPLAGALRRATSTTADFPVALAAKDLRFASGTTPVVEATLSLLAAVPDQQADICALIDRESR
ncbi:dehydrogenase [Actinoplanes ianthinogenes]|uniref:Dehydrogenase n=1 Tax=Actinoplanes ianthinogenes TaxID=122358 RepID=A0ABN6C2H1_9ACTN|nr:NAD(P)-binding domain-containing protein [Actinoplanes ianthinogenes]BCJ39715.1 dehydrogenase [Actinoplanes ianthinogenes]GGR47914.1 dehydrogenase [Actinoplanes ianthinogenes]